MKNLKFLLAGALAVLALASCTDKEIPDNVEHDESYYAEKATISSDNSLFTSTSDGGYVNFAEEGGEVRISVDCGVDWIVENTASDIFSTSTNAVTLTISAGQNAVKAEVSGVLTLYTSSYHIKFATVTVTQAAYGTPSISVETDSWNAPAIGELTTEIAVNSNKEWEYKFSAKWLTIERTDNGLRLTVTENDDTESRSDEVQIIVNDGVSTVSQIITVTQDGTAYINPSKRQFTFYDEAQTSIVEIESNFDWDYSYDSSNGWFTLSRNGNQLTATVTANNVGEARQSEITLTAGDGAENNTELEFIIIQYGPQPDALIFDYTVSSGATIHLPVYGSPNCTVDWGDDSDIEDVTTSNPTHTYTSSGTYSVRINGTVSELNSLNYSDNNKSDTALTAVRQWGNTGLKDLSYAFYYCKGLKSVVGDTSGAFSDVTSFDYAFQWTSIETLPSDLFAYASSATSFVQTFYYCQSLTAVPEGLFDKCSKVNTFYAAFNSCTALKTIPTGLFDNCPEAISFNGTFYNCKSLQAIPDALFDNCVKASDFTYTFGECESLTAIPESLFAKCVNATTYYATFYKCSAIQAIPEGLFDNNVKAGDFTGTFYECGSIQTMPSGLFDDCSAAESFYMTFVSCTSLTNISEGLFDNCPNVTNFQSAFEKCESIKSIPAGLFDNCPKANTFYATFYGLSNITSIPSGLFDNCPDVTTFWFAFYNCKSITEIPEGLFDKCTKVTIFNATFYNCQKLVKIPENLFKYCTEVTDFSWCFYQCKALPSYPTGLFDYNKKVTNFSYTFYNIPDVTGESPYTLVDGVKVHLYERSAANGFTAPTAYTGCFRSSKQLDDYENIPDEWK